MGNQHIIEVNGKRYDALTGKMVNDQYTPSKSSSKHPHKSTGTSMDGFARRSSPASGSSEHLRRTVQKSKTLMRTTVQKPKNHKVHAVATIVHQSSPAKTPSASAAPRHLGLSSKIKNVPKSPLIRKFGPSVYADTIFGGSSKPEEPQEIPRGRVSAEAAPTFNPLHQAVADATSHKQPKLKKPKLHHRLAGKLNIRPKVMSGGVFVLALLLLAGFFGYQNVPNLQMRLAAQRAGVKGNLPAYQPPGFRLDNISHKPGEINITYQSNSDDRKFAVTQATSAWNSETLRDKLKTSQDTANPVEIPDKGKTLFIYNDSNITWVDGGIWYKVEGDSKLNSDQLLRLANSL